MPDRALTYAHNVRGRRAIADVLLAIGVVTLISYALKYASQSMELVGLVLGARLLLCVLAGAALASPVWLLRRLIGSDPGGFLISFKLLTGLALIVSTLAGMGTTVPEALLRSLG